MHLIAREFLDITLAMQLSFDLGIENQRFLVKLYLVNKILEERQLTMFFYYAMTEGADICLQQF